MEREQTTIRITADLHNELTLMSVQSGLTVTAGDSGNQECGRIGKWIRIIGKLNCLFWVGLKTLTINNCL